MLTEIKRQLKGRLLTAAVGSNRYIGTDVKSLAEIADYVFVMTYDLGIAHSDIFSPKYLSQCGNYQKFRAANCA